MSLLPPPPAPQQQRRAVGAPAARGRGLYSDAVGLHPDVRIEPSRHPTTSVGLHDGPKFAPQHRAVAAPAALDIGAMVAARLSTPEPVLSTATEFDGTFDEPKPKAAPAEPMSAEPEPAEPAPATRRGSMVAARLSAGYKEMNEEDKLTGMDAYDYGMFSNVASYALETKQKKTLFGKKKETTSTVYFKTDDKPVARSVVLEDDKHKLPNDTHGIALVATVDKNWKGDRFQVDKVDKVKVFGTGAVNKYPVAYNAKHGELMTPAYAIYEDLREGWVKSFELTKPDGNHDVDHVEMLGGRFVDKKKTKYKLDGEGLHVSKETVPLENIVPAVAKLQNDAQTHTTFTTGARGGTTKSEEGPSDLSMGSAETVSIEEAKNIDYIAHLVGDGFLTYLKTSLARDPDDGEALEELKKTAADNGDELDRPFVIPVDSGYSSTDAGAKQYLEELGFVGVGKLETLSGLLVVPMPTPADAGDGDRKKIFGNDKGLAKMRWERIFPGEFAPLMPVAGQGNQYLDVNVLEEGKYELQDEYGKLLYGTLTPRATPDNKYQDGDERKDSLATLGQKLAEQTVALSAKKKGEDLEPLKAEIEATKTAMRTIQTQLEQIWGSAPRPPLRAKPSDADMTFTLNDEYSRRKFACAVFGLHAAPGGEMKISKRPLLMPRVSNEPISVAHIQRIWALGPAAADETKPAGGGVELHNALPMAMRGEGLDLRFLWCAMKIAQRCMNNAMGVTRKSSVGNVLVGLKGNKSISTETKSKYRMLLGVENYADATKSRDEMKIAEAGDACCAEMDFADFEELSEAAQLALLEDQL